VLIGGGAAGAVMYASALDDMVLCGGHTHGGAGQKAATAQQRRGPRQQGERRETRVEQVAAGASPRDEGRALLGTTAGTRVYGGSGREEGGDGRGEVQSVSSFWALPGCGRHGPRPDAGCAARRGGSRLRMPVRGNVDPSTQRQTLASLAC
jgi:hypothetical protein